MKLHLHSDSDRDDLVDWMLAHIQEPDWPEGTLLASVWLGQRLPGVIDVPAEHAAAIEFVIDDWSEVLASHDEDHHTYLEEA